MNRENKLEISHLKQEQENISQSSWAEQTKQTFAGHIYITHKKKMKTVKHSQLRFAWKLCLLKLGFCPSSFRLNFSSFVLY